MIYLKILSESISQALHQLYSNKLRSFLSLLGITIGIWCVIVVLSAVDSLERMIMNSLQELGDDVVYVSKMPWTEDPGQSWWKYQRRPEPGYKDFQVLKKRVDKASAVSYMAFIGAKNLEYRSNDVSNVFVIGTTFDYGDIYNIKFEDGRYFTQHEHKVGSSQIIVGYEVANNLFPSGIDPIGKKIKMMGRKWQIIGVMEKEGKDLVNPLNFDELVIMSYKSAQNFVNTRKSRGGFLTVKAAEGVSLDELKGEITGVLRANRRLSPKESDNFALNTLSILTNQLGTLFSVISIGGFIIGFFSILVGGFGVANIMFVSVKERTNLIGIKKALGAKRWYILTEFLIESIVLCSLGGLIGLGLVFLVARIATVMLELEFVLSLTNIIIGVGFSVVIGVVAGLVPAFIAAMMDPVEAIRS